MLTPLLEVGPNLAQRVKMCNLTNAQGEDKRTAGPEAVEGSERECYILCKSMEVGQYKLKLSRYLKNTQANNI
ncbi:hypothetical protein Y1Q_0015551 [Alligator mississippiensis]|uniref:Uncharacterized protein n=1 Tax=Alligator mississippiensis TaxID=8496 RepID=A0A151NNC8_ALLMI|nr:hypothetical protein Y1Q_0015551 [Alligator mississippiensis]